MIKLKDEIGMPLPKDGSYYVAGSTAGDLGRQMGGWSISWQGSSGATTTGTTGTQGIREVAPAADVTFSADASAPMAGHDVGDVGNNENSLELTAADRATIDRVCAAMTCVVLIVSGRPQIITDRLSEIDTLIASFLPGGEGAGVADVLFGEKPFTGR